jgi:hypothetical protein
MGRRQVTAAPNPTVQPASARSKISKQMFAEEYGVSCRAWRSPSGPKVAQIAYGLLSRDVFISVEQRTPGNLDPEELAILRRVIDLIQANVAGGELGLC